MDMDRGDPPYVGAHDPREAERLAAQSAGGERELRAAFTSQPPPERARVLELGCGGGDFTCALLEVLPEAAITATDRDPRLLDHARHALAPVIHSGRVHIQQADAGNLPFEARSFDVVACRFVLMHQADPWVVVAEMFRVLSPGGLALAIEPDWGARALYPDAEALDRLLNLAHGARTYGFPDLLLGRKLYALFADAGFNNVQIHPIAFSQTAADMPASTEECDRLPGPEGLLEQARDLLRHENLIAESDLDDLIRRLRAVRHHRDYFSAGLDFVATGIKPATGWEVTYP